MAPPADRAAYRTLLGGMLQITGLPSGITLSTPGDIDDILDAALEEFTHDHPVVRVKGITGDGSKQRFILSTDLDTDWAEGFSTIRELRLRSNTDTNALGRNLQGEDFALLQEDESGVTKTILLLAFAHSTVEDLDVTYVLPHDLDASPITIPATEAHSFAQLAAAHGATWIAQRASDQRDTQVNADAVDYGAISEKFSDRAKEWRGLYERTVKPDEQKMTASFVAMEEPLQIRARRNTHFRLPRRP